MGTPSRRHLARRHLEILVLGAGLLSAAVMAFAALRVVEDPRASGQAALARLAGQVADGVVAEWARLLRDAAPPAPPLGESFLWTAEEARAIANLGAPPAGGEPLLADLPESERQARATAFDALLGEARRLEVLQSDAPQALATVLDALERAPDAVRRGAGRLRAIQLAVKARRGDVAVTQWAGARAELAGAERTAEAPGAPLAIDVAPPDTSLLLLCGLAAAPALDELARAELCRDLSARWCNGRLALPDVEDVLSLPMPDVSPDVSPDAAPDTAPAAAKSAVPRAVSAEAPGGAWTAVPPRREALRRRLLAVAPDCGADGAAWREDAARRLLAALATVLGGLPGSAPRAPRDATFDGAVRAWETGPSAAGDEAWQFDTRAALPFLWRVAPDGGCRGQFTTWPHVRQALAASVQRHALLPDGFLLDFGADASEAPLVRERIALCGDAFGFALRHRDPAAFVGDETRRAAWLRGGLLVLAALAAVATLLTARALRRERALAALRSAFIAGVSHELRTPVSSILLLADNLQAGRIRGEAGLQRYHELIRREALRLRRLVDDVLDMSRLERGETVKLQFADIALPAFVQDVAAEARELVERAGGRFVLQAGEGVAALPAAATLDAEAVRRALLNLVDNALRHSGSADVTLAALVEGDGPGRTALVLRVTDSGRGIPQRERERIFEPFERLGAGAGAGSVAAPAGTTSVGTAPGVARATGVTDVTGEASVSAVSAAPGVGLGLAIVRAIARGHGGEVRVVEAPAVGADAGGPHTPASPGACFEIRLPLDALDGEAPAVDRAPGRRP